MRRLLSESLCFDGHQVESVGDAAMLWEHLGNTQPDLVLLNAHLDGFGAMKLYFDIQEKLPDLAVIFKWILIDTNKLKKVIPFGREVFYYNYLLIKNQQRPIRFVGPNALHLAPT
jgi:DNA-binding NtrC family response regulator